MNTARSDIKPLVVTPIPKKDESLRGFLLRTTQENVYDSQSVLLRYVGLSEKELRLVTFPIDKLAPLYGCNSEKLKQLELQRRTIKVETSSTRSKRFKEEKQVFSYYGHDLFRSHFHLGRTNFCIQCAVEDGYISAFWNLKFAFACHHHNAMRFNICPSCSNRISWYRPTLLRCRCGYDLTKVSAKSVTDKKLLALQEIIWLKFHHKPLSSASLNAGFPIEDLEKMSLRTLFGLIERLYNQSGEGKLMKAKEDIELSAVEIAAGVFVNWPSGFYDYLTTIGNVIINAKSVNYGFVRQFYKFNAAIMKSGLAKDEIQFMRDAFIEFGKSVWKKAYMHPKWKKKNTIFDQRVVGINEAAKHIGVTRRMLNKLIEEDFIHPIIVGKGNKRRLLFDLSMEMPKKINYTKSIPVREVGKLVGLPVKVLVSLRRKGVFKIRYLGDKVNSFHEYDVIDFQNRLLEIVRSINKITKPKESLITIAQVMQMKAGSPKFKASVVVAVLSGELQIKGKMSNNFNQIALCRQSVLSFIQDIKQKEFDSYSAVSAGQLLCFMPGSIKWLVENNYLKADDRFKYLRITAASLSAFTKKYVSCLEIARSSNTSSRRVEKLCNETDVTVMHSKNTHEGWKQSFILREDLKKLDGLNDASICVARN